MTFSAKFFIDSYTGVSKHSLSFSVLGRLLLLIMLTRNLWSQQEIAEAVGVVATSTDVVIVPSSWELVSHFEW